MPDPSPPLGLDIDRCITFFQGKFILDIVFVGVIYTMYLPLDSLGVIY